MPTESFTIGKARYTAAGPEDLEVSVALDDNPTTTKHEIPTVVMGADDWENAESTICTIAAFNGYLVSRLRRVKAGLRYDTRPCRTDKEVQRRIFPVITDYIMLARQRTPIDATFDAMEIIKHDFAPTEIEGV